MQSKSSYTRRALSRIEPTDELWVCWHCNGRDDVSRVLNLSPDGIFIHTTHKGLHVGLVTKLDFLVQEGRLRADAAIRHVQRGSGLGLKFTSLADEDRSRLRILLARLRPNATRPNSQPNELSDA